MTTGLLRHLKKEAQRIVPRLPFMGSEPEERLPGMVEWTPRRDIVRIGKMLREGYTPEDISQQEVSQGLFRAMGYKSLLGALGGIAGGRLVGGESAYAPFKEIKAKGLSRETLKGLADVPLPMKVLPIAGLLAGGGLGLHHWVTERDRRRRKALDVAHGLLTEDVLRYKSLNRPALSGIPIETASHASPTVAMAGNTGV